MLLWTCTCFNISEWPSTLTLINLQMTYIWECSSISRMSVISTNWVIFLCANKVATITLCWRKYWKLEITTYLGSFANCVKQLRFFEPPSPPPLVKIILNNKNFCVFSTFLRGHSLMTSKKFGGKEGSEILSHIHTKGIFLDEILWPSIYKSHFLIDVISEWPLFPPKNVM